MEIRIAVYHLVKQIVIQGMLMLVRKTGLCPYNTFLYGQVKERYNERLFHDFWVTNGTIRIKEYEYSKPMDVTHVSDL